MISVFSRSTLAHPIVDDAGDHASVTALPNENAPGSYALGTGKGSLGISYPYPLTFNTIFQEELRDAMSVRSGRDRLHPSEKDLITLSLKAYYAPETWDVYNRIFRDYAVNHPVNSSTIKEVTREAVRAIIQTQHLVNELERTKPATVPSGDTLCPSRSMQDLPSVWFNLQHGLLRNAEDMVSSAYNLQADGRRPLTVELTNIDGGPVAQVLWRDGLIMRLNAADFDGSRKRTGFSLDRYLAHEMVHAIMARTTGLRQFPTWFKEGTAEFVVGADERVAVGLKLSNPQALVNLIFQDWNGSSDQYASAYIAVRYLHAQIKKAGGRGMMDLMEFLGTHPKATLEDAFRQMRGSLGYPSIQDFFHDLQKNGAKFIASMDLQNDDVGAAGGFDADAGTVKTNTTVVPDDMTCDDVTGLRGFDVHYVVRSPYDQLFRQ